MAVRKNKVSWKRDFQRNYQLYLLLLPAVLSMILFNYLPMYGIQIAFKDFKPIKGIWGSEWAGLKWFRRFWESYQCLDVISNTLILSIALLVCTFPIPILFALLVNQYKNGIFRKTLQTVSYAPHFISTVVMVGMILMFLSPSSGLYGSLAKVAGFEPRNVMGDSALFRPIYILSEIWQQTGWDSIIYIAALSAVDVDLYDAARVDGAGRLKRILHIDIPALRDTAVVILILRIGNIMSLGFEKTYLLQNNLNLGTSEIIATYVYKIGLTGTPQYSYTAAIGLLNSLVNLILLIAFNKISKRISGSGLW